MIIKRRKGVRYSFAPPMGEKPISLKAIPFSQLNGEYGSLAHILDVPFFRTIERHGYKTFDSYDAPIPPVDFG